MDKLVGGRDEVPSHDESDAFTERRPAIMAPCRPWYAPLAVRPQINWVVKKDVAH